MTTTTNLRVDSYLTGVAAALDDLPRGDREDLLEEVREHLDDLAHESDAPLTVRLGEPEAYAAELRASAGLPPRGRASRASVTRTLGSARDALLAQSWVRPVLGFLISVRPLWWVARAWLLVSAVVLVQWGSWGAWSTRLPLVPHVGSGLTGALVVLVVAVASVQVGRHGWGVRARRALIAVNAVLVVAAVPVLASLSDATERTVMQPNTTVQYVTEPPQQGTWTRGYRVLNVYPYDANGHLLTDVRLYDDLGRPLDLQLGQDPNRRAVFDRTGQPATNAFPLRYFEPGTRVVANPSAGPQVVVPPLVPQPMTASATPQASATSTASATP
ncbi:HAAS signaling domain-containing protein [Oryzihumus sp.]